MIVIELSDSLRSSGPPCDFSHDKAPEKNLDMWFDNNRYKLFFGCSDFSEMEDIFEEAEYSGLPTSCIYDSHNDIMLIAIGPDRVERISKLTSNIENL